MIKFYKFFVYICLLVFVPQLYSFEFPFFKKCTTKTPNLQFITYDKDTKTLLTNISVQTTRISTKEKKGESFIYKYTISANGYNSLSDSIAIDYSFKGKAFPITNYLEPLIHKPMTLIRHLSIEGTIYDTNQAPFPDCLIKIKTNTNVLLTHFSDSNGIFSFTNMPFHNYHLTIKAPVSNYILFQTNIIPQTNQFKTNHYAQLIFKVYLRHKVITHKTKKIVKKKLKRKIKRKKKKLTNYQRFVKHHYKVPPFTTINLKNKTLILDPEQTITVERGATLILNHCRIYSKSLWNGIRVKKNATLIIRKSDLSKAKKLIHATASKKILIDSSEIFKNNVAIQSYYSPIHILHSTIQYNTNAIMLVSSSLNMNDATIYKNNSSLTATNSKITIKNSAIHRNKNGLVLKKSIGDMLYSNIYENHSDGITLIQSQLKYKYSNLFSNHKNGILCIDSNPFLFSNNIYNNKFYAIKNGGVVNSCFIGYNNFSNKVDSTPNSGKKDNHFDTVSNMFIKQLYKVDVITNLQLRKISFQGEQH